MKEIRRISQKELEKLDTRENVLSFSWYDLEHLFDLSDDNLHILHFIRNDISSESNFFDDGKYYNNDFGKNKYNFRDFLEYNNRIMHDILDEKYHNKFKLYHILFPDNIMKNMITSIPHIIEIQNINSANDWNDWNDFYNDNFSIIKKESKILNDIIKI